MTQECKQIQEILIDKFDHEFEITDEIKQHLASCSQCQTFYQQLDQLSQQLTVTLDPIAIDYELIHRAVNEGNKTRKTRENLWSNAIFLLVAITLFLSIGLIIHTGYIQVIALIQVIVFVVSPALIPLTINKQIKGDAS